MDEQALVQQVLAGDQGAYAPLVRAHQAPILRLCTSLLRDAALAEDAAQEVFLKAYQKLPSFRGQAAFGTWLYRIATNQCLDLLRKHRRERTESWDALIEEQGELPAEPGTTSDPQATAATSDLVRQALKRLSPDYQMILTLREVEGLSYAELATVLRCSPEAVKGRLRRARAELLQAVRHFSAPSGV